MVVLTNYEAILLVVNCLGWTCVTATVGEATVRKSRINSHHGTAAEL